MCFATPVPALPAVRLAGLQRVGAYEVEHAALAAVRRVDELRLAVAVELAEDRCGPVGLVHALDLAGDERARLVPADAHVAARAAVLRVALALRVPVHALHRVGDAVLRVHALLVAQRQRRDERLEARLEGLSAGLELPGVQVLGRVVLVEAQRADAQYLVVLLVDVDRARVRADAEAVEAQALHDGRAQHVVPHALSSPGLDVRRRCFPLGGAGAGGSTRSVRAAWARSAPSARRARRGPAAGWARPEAWGSRGIGAALAPQLGQASAFGSTSAPHLGHFTGPLSTVGGLKHMTELLSQLPWSRGLRGPKPR